eukprot:262342-Amphidinium_carterae.1
MFELLFCRHGGGLALCIVEAGKTKTRDMGADKGSGWESREACGLCSQITDAHLMPQPFLCKVTLCLRAA